jgi:hypothetical protein
VKHFLKGRVLPVVVGAAVVVTGANVASFAADGHTFRLGAGNHESRPTSVTNDGSGPAFRFKTDDSVAPFAVTSGVKVAHLNATRVDGLKAGELSRSYRYVLPAGTALPSGFQATDLPPGHYTVSFNLALDTGDDTTPAFCFVPDSRHEFAAVARGVVYEGGQIVNGSGLAFVGQTGEAGLVCESGGTVVNPGGPQFRNSLVFTRVRSVHQGTVGGLPGPVVKHAIKEWPGR